MWLARIEGLEGVQQLGGVWKIYLKAVKHRCELLSRKTLWIQSKMVALFDQNPYQNNLQSRDKLTIKGLPLHMKNDDLKTMLESKGVVLCSPIKFSLIRDETGQFTNYKNGDRFLYCEPLPQPIPRQQQVGDHNCYVYHHGEKHAMQILLPDGTQSRRYRMPWKSQGRQYPCIQRI